MIHWDGDPALQYDTYLIPDNVPQKATSHMRMRYNKGPVLQFHIYGVLYKVLFEECGKFRVGRLVETERIGHSGI